MMPYPTKRAQFAVKISPSKNAVREKYLELLLQERQEFLSHQLIAERLGERPNVTATGMEAGGQNITGTT